MKTITLLRHSHAAWSNTRDIDRPLTGEGNQACTQLASQLLRISWQPDHLLISPAVRTQQTAQCIVDALGLSAVKETVDTIYNAHYQTLLSLLQNCDEKYQHICLIGHNPGLTELAHTLDEKCRISLSPANAVMFNVLNSWSMIMPNGVDFQHLIKPV